METTHDSDCVGKKLDIPCVTYFCVLVTSLLKRNFDLTALISPLILWDFCNEK